MFSSQSAGLRRIRWLFCDIDGTLTDGDGRAHSARLPPLLEQLKARNVRIGVVSGRDTPSALVVHRLFALNGPIIAENGAEMILDPAKDEGSPRVCGGLSSSQIAGLARRMAEQGLFEHFSMDRDKTRMLTLYPRSFPNHEPRDLPLWSRRMAAVLGDSLRDLEVTYSSAAIDICARGTNKGNGIALACECLCTPPATVAFVGDSNNDQTAFHFVRQSGGWLAFVGADPTVKEALQDYSRVFFPREYASKGTAEFIQFLLERDPLLSDSEA